ncbi:methionyl-tRNA formyltransferase [Candidatus Saccharibacteria bacterium]|nr:methionyl-tRNA formyltransferase [Candidatus Saccharibacteria bacterium]MCL1963148.1 methionyl-tRNA formyltransferase [Candidatus Saccharibacteria bacterium]
MKNKIVFFGNEQLAQGLEKPITPIFDALIAHDYEVAALVLPRDPSSKSRSGQKMAIIEAAERNNISIVFADQESDLDGTLRKFGAEIGVLASFGKIVRQSTIDAFPRGIVNIHPSLLPKYRGSTPIETAILNGDNETGVSLMQLVAKMDAGGVFAAGKIALNGDETKQELYEKLANLGAELLIENLPKIMSGELPPAPQNDADATFTAQLSKTAGDLDPTTMTATECERKVRAFLNFPRTRLHFMGQETVVTAARIVPNFAGDDWADIIPCAGDTFLQVTELINPKSGKKMRVADYLRGLR